MKNTTSPVERDDVGRLLERDIAPKARSGAATETAQQTSINDESRGVVSMKNTTSPVERDDGYRLLERDIAPRRAVAEPPKSRSSRQSMTKPRRREGEEHDESRQS